MSDTIEDILKQRRMDTADLKNSSEDTIRKILLLISPEEISRLCATSQKFNRICEDQSFWRVKVQRDYGIEKKYKSTWKETAIAFYKVNMINLNKKWIDGRTYSKIIEEASNSEDSIRYLMRLQDEYFPENIDQGFFSAAIFILDGDMHDGIVHQMDRDLTDEEIKPLEKIFTSEFAIIFNAFFQISSLYRNLPLDLQDNYLYTGDSAEKKILKIVLPLIDINPYIMFFSSLTDDDLDDIRKLHRQQYNLYF